MKKRRVRDIPRDEVEMRLQLEKGFNSSRRRRKD